MKPEEFEIFIACIPGLERELLAEIKQIGFNQTKLSVGGVSFFGDWRDVWRANFYLRGATKVLVRFASFRATHLVGRLVNTLKKVDGTLFLTADHGNCELMTDPVTGNPHTAHTLNPVPAILFNGPENKYLSDGGRLSDIAPTILELMDLNPPAEMTGNSLLI